jgi:hypothetical protein
MDTGRQFQGEGPVLVRVYIVVVSVGLFWYLSCFLLFSARESKGRRESEALSRRVEADR